MDSDLRVSGTILDERNRSRQLRQEFDSFASDVACLEVGRDRLRNGQIEAKPPVERGLAALTRSVKMLQAPAPRRNL